MEWVATVNAVVAKVATPADSVPVPNVVVPSLNVTVPVGAAPVDGVTVAVKVTDAPEVDGFKDDFRAVVVGDGLTTWINGAETLPASFELPP